MLNINQKIKSKINKMHPTPKWQYLVRQIALDAVLALSWIAAVVIVGITIYTLSHYNPWENLPKGLNNFWQAVKDLPWEMFFVLLLLVIIIYFASRKAYFIYRINSLLILAFIIGSVAIGYYIAEKTGIHQNISQAPIAKQLYIHQGKVFLVSRGAVVTGEISGAKENHLIITDVDNRQWAISFDKSTVFINGKDFRINEIIKINGLKQEANHIQATVVQKLDASWRGFFDKFQDRNLVPCADCNVY